MRNSEGLRAPTLLNGASSSSVQSLSKRVLLHTGESRQCQMTFLSRILKTIEGGLDAAASSGSDFSSLRLIDEGFFLIRFHSHFENSSPSEKRLKHGSERCHGRSILACLNQKHYRIVLVRQLTVADRFDRTSVPAPSKHTGLRAHSILAASFPFLSSY